MNYKSMSKQELEQIAAAKRAQHEKYKAEGLSLNMARGKPCPEQETLSLDMLDVVSATSDLKDREGLDLLNYGCLEGLPECRELYGEILGVPADKVIVCGNSSLTLMFDFIAQCYYQGVSKESKPWVLQDKVKFLCPVPGYDRHFGICEYLGIEMVNVPITENGPDMDVVEELVKDPAVKGMFCVPKYSNPTGCTYSDETVRRLASMETAPDFRIIWDNAYCVHDFNDHGDELLEMLHECEAAGHPERAVEFASSSKISFPGAGIAVFACNEPNFSWIVARMKKQTIGFDKINQARHVRFFKNADGIRAHMGKMAEIVVPHFNVVLDAFEKELKPLGIAEWTNPNGGYFISLNVLDGCAQRVYDLCKDAGVKLTGCGATFPYGKDPQDRNIRIAPTYPELEELKKATEVLVNSIELACAEKLLTA